MPSIMKFRKRFLFAITFIIFCIPFTLTAYGFVVRSIQIQGLQGISADTVRSYLPIHEGQEYTAQRGQRILQSLYRTGFFETVRLARRGDALIISVKERPIISLIRISGNKAISTKKLRPILNKLNISEGQPYDPTKLHEIEVGLEQQYGAMGYHAATVSTRVVKETKNRVALYIHINEGGIAKVGSIQFVGNRAFSARTLRNQFKLTTPGLFTWISHRDRYSQVKLEEDLQQLSEFYLNHGYLRFRVVSHDVQWSPDKKHVYITIHLVEGPIYHLSGYTITGETYGFKDQLYRLVKLKRGDIFSRQVIINTNKAIGDFLGDRGYAFARVNVIPTIDDQQHLVHLTFNVAPGERVYVRRISFFGNQRTDQEVLRREMRQYEGSLYSLSKIEESKRRLELLGYLSDVKYTPQIVPNSPDQVDLNYHVKEIAAGRASIQGGYSDVYGFLYGASISEPNFMGTGKYVSIGFQNSQYQQNYSFVYNNPYYTTWGLQRGFSIYYSRVKPNTKFNLSSYVEDGYGADVTYAYPISERNSIGFGYGFEHIKISQVDPAIAAPSVLAFLGTTNGVQNTSRDYNQFKLNGGWTYNGLDRAIFPTKGLYTGIGLEIGVPVLKSSLGYYLATYSAKYYQPIWHGFILNLLATVGYGDGFGHDRLPFFKNFYAGGIGSVPAFSPNSLGPKNRYNSFGAIGGNLETIFGVHLILPQFISERVRTAIVFDAGNVFQVPRFPGDIAVPARATIPDPEAATRPQIIQNDRFSLKNLRPSLGLAVEWYTPLAPIDLTLAFPLNRRPGDNFQAFQFSFGVSL
ncbi:outer membrane protein assembly factor BamA [Coxiella burnetii]|uniref:Outer membrane protein assembly factor BamA n=2 Tax=Coxiella burnetii TaxID=777 RepID=A9KC32_COXBN|nr:outer membrane protein assembly factor BamA [Coxiella burnetii]ABS76818.1 outer membrane protein assembly factor [Coxiella burnetii Dugway 5J108-111]ABX78493.1 outer membrane protein assembly complex, YaeT protein [Coxiella burnetii RSA 331]ATN74067.1 outer membrane protein assembly factor BamA [Coxiella burnetii]ATN75972.1 outer membrane protein assembly factor BamA [Coxiella burnetii]ATN77886.1 outer membrane protein assembly factor BamA [Coxiella burnetii]